MIKLMSNARRSVFLPLILIASCLLILVVSTAAPTRNQSNDFSFTILHTNDLHSHDESFAERGRIIGGFARIGHMIRLLKENNPNTLVIDAGDIFQGTPLFTRYHGEVEVTLLNKMGYDIYTIGNHEFDDGPVNLAKQLKQAKFKIIDCNLDCSKQPELERLIEPSLIKEIGGQKVAFIGVMTPELPRLALNSGGVTVKAAGREWMRPVAEEVARIKEKGVDKIILVTHCGLDLDKLMAESMPDVDAIIGGHSHTRLDKAIVVDHGDDTSTTIVQTGCFGRALGKLDLTFDNAGRVIPSSTRYRLINITDKIRPEPELLAYIDKMAEPLLPLRRTIAATATADFDNRWSNYPWDSAIGDLICDALADSGKDYGVQIAFENRGGIRGRIEKGPISLEKVEEILPFDNRVVFATISGACLRRNLEHSVAGGLGGKFLDQHGLKIAYDPVRPDGEKLVFVLIEDKNRVWRPIKDDQTYKMAINDYSFKTGEGYDFKESTDTRFLTDRLSAALNAYLKKMGTVSPQTPSRIVPVSPDILTVEASSKSAPILRLKGGLQGAKITLVAGSAKGISNIGGVPVPIANAAVVMSGRCDTMGECTWAMPIKLPGLYKTSKNEKPGKSTDSPSVDLDSSLCAGKGKAFICAIVQPPKTVAGKRTLISYPVVIEKAEKD